MDPSPTTTAGRGEPILQPGYFTSSAYVLPLREDISNLVHACGRQFSAQQSPFEAFPMFKTVWVNQGWNWMIFKVLDDRSRQMFLNVTARLFLEKTLHTEDVFTRVIALFALYTFFYTQPSSNCTPPLYAISHIPIPSDHYESLLQIPSVLQISEDPQLAQLRGSVCYILKTMVNGPVFRILPSSDKWAQSPRQLPREIVQDENWLDAKAKGRTSKRTKAVKGKAALDQLDGWAHLPGTAVGQDHGSAASLKEYQGHKSDLLAGIDRLGAADKVVAANLAVVQRLRQAGDIVDGDRPGIERVERAAMESGGGILRLLEGAGKLEE